MQTQITPRLLETPEGQEADRILRSCVHCGFCTATCPTYVLTGNELDSPRGRIYLIKGLLEQGQATALTRTHLDRCLSCQSCETTCPSDVDYHRLLDIGRAQMSVVAPRTPWQRFRRRLLLGVLGNRRLFGSLLALGRLLRPLLPTVLREKVPPKQGKLPRRELRAHARKVVLLEGCVQPALTPATNVVTTRVLDRLGITALKVAQESCCGAMAYHLDFQGSGLDQARVLVDQCLLHLEQGAEYIISSASGCGNFIKSYAALLARDPVYAERAAKVQGRTLDLAEFLAGEDLSGLRQQGLGRGGDSRDKGEACRPLVAFHCPCSLQHGQGLAEVVPDILRQLGYELAPVEDSHLCCGSAGTYSLLQPGMSRQLRDRKLASLEAGAPALIVTANVGCEAHLSGASSIPVRHWIELLDC